MSRKLSITLLIVFLFSSIPFSKLNALNGYRPWGDTATSLSVAGGQSTNIALTDDGFGNIITSWTDTRTDTGDIYIQKFNNAGVAQWTTNGVVVAATTNAQNGSNIIPDGSGGAIVTWTDARTDAGDIYAQRVSSAGVAQWTANGVVIANPTSTQTTPSIVSDGNGGAVIAWTDLRGGVTNDVYAQRINSSGTVQWTANGVVISTATSNQSLSILFKNQSIISDGNGGAIITWVDTRTDAGDVYTQRVDSTGAVQWTANGVVIVATTGAQNQPYIQSDYQGGALIAWSDPRTDANDIYAQRINASGTVQWTANGVVVAATTNSQVNAYASSDKLGNYFIAWQDNRVAPSQQYIQKLNFSGTAQWTANGIKVSSNTTDTLGVGATVHDGKGGVYVGWSNSGKGVYYQNFDTSGTALWDSRGVNAYNDTTVIIGLNATRDFAGDLVVVGATTPSQLGKISKIATVNRVSISNFSDQLSRINESIVASHTVKFVTSYSIGGDENIKVTFPGAFVFGSSYDFNDMQLSVGSTNDCETATFTNKTIASTASGTTWGATFSSQVATFLSGTDTIPISRCVRMTFNTNGTNHTITNPTVGADTVYRLSIQSDRQSGDAAVIILDDAGTPDSDQIEIDGRIETSISLDLDTVVTGCNNSTETSLNAVDLGLLTPGTVKKSDASIKFICIDSGTNAGLGLNLFARSNRSNAVGALVSGGNAIVSATADLTNVGVTSGYGIRVSSVGTPNFGSLTINSPFNSGTPGSVGQLPGILSAAAQIVDSTAPVETGTASRIAVEVAAKSEFSTPPGAYSDIISFTVLVNF